MTDRPTDRPFEPTLYARDYRTALAALTQVVSNQFRGPTEEAKTAGESELALDPHELRAVAAGLVGILDAVHGAATGIANHAAAALADDAMPWEHVEPITADDVDHANEPTEFHPRPDPPTTSDDLVVDAAAGMAAMVRDRSLHLAAQVGEAAVTGRLVLSDLRDLTSREMFDRDTGRRVGAFYGKDGLWTYERIVDPHTGAPRTELLDQIPVDRLVQRARPVEPAGAELDESVLEHEHYARKLDLPEPAALADPTAHGWRLLPDRTRPIGATEVSETEGLSRTWISPTDHTLNLFWVTPTRITHARYDNHTVPLLLPVLNLLITQGASLT